MAQLKVLLGKFYADNDIPQGGGADDSTFDFLILGLRLKLPNPKFRQEVVHIHDIEHVLNDCDTSWKGEAFVAGWEIATRIWKWKYFPVGLLSLWAMGYSLWLYPRSVYGGYSKGLLNIGIIDLDYTEAELVEMEFKDLESKITRASPLQSGAGAMVEFLWWCLISQIVFLFPLMLIIVGLGFAFLGNWSN